MPLLLAFNHLVLIVTLRSKDGWAPEHSPIGGDPPETPRASRAKGFVRVEQGADTRSRLADSNLAAEDKDAREIRASTSSNAVVPRCPPLLMMILLS